MSLYSGHLQGNLFIFHDERVFPNFNANGKYAFKVGQDELYGLKIEGKTYGFETTASYWKVDFERRIEIDLFDFAFEFDTHFSRTYVSFKNFLITLNCFYKKLFNIKYLFQVEHVNTY